MNFEVCKKNLKKTKKNSKFFNRHLERLEQLSTSTILRN